MQTINISINITRNKFQYLLSSCNNNLLTSSFIPSCITMTHVIFLRRIPWLSFSPVSSDLVHGSHSPILHSTASVRIDTLIHCKIIAYYMEWCENRVIKNQYRYLPVFHRKFWVISFDGGGRPHRYKPICKINVISNPVLGKIIVLCWTV